MQQATLWDALEEEPEQPIPVPPIGGTIERPARWADGDTSHEALTKLANHFLQDITTMHTTDGTPIWFRIVKTRIERDHVIMTMQRIEPRVRGYIDWQRAQGMPVSDEE